LSCRFGSALQPLPVLPTMTARGAKSGEPVNATFAVVPPPFT
jgi:hypothetical protein